ncbi:MAG: gliding motility-associated C-terminal domain-containing protein, partial [Salinimicrobium sp.]
SAAGCESDAAMLEVTLTDTAAPTLVQGGNVFCEFDGATLAELEQNVNANGVVTWYTSATGDETYNTSEVLSDGVSYYASATPSGDCESSQRLQVTVTLESCEIVIPEIFSPNGDTINDEFVIENLAAEYPGYKLEIYNRWGEPVYKGNASTPSWDGTSTEGSFGSGILPAGVYFYILYYNDGTTPPTQGRVYLSR